MSHEKVIDWQTDELVSRTARDAGVDLHVAAIALNAGLTVRQLQDLKWPHLSNAIHAWEAVSPNNRLPTVYAEIIPEPAS
jgi:hypothetical protein